MRLLALWLASAAVPLLSAANPFQPVIAPNGVVNGASNLSPEFAGYGIARGSLFVIYGSALGPVDLARAASYPLPTNEGLAGTRVLISIGAYNAACPMVYTSINQVAAIMPSDAPEGDGVVVVAYQNLASTASAIRVVRSAFGVFTRNQAGTGPAIVQNFVSQSEIPVNSLISAARPGQTVILWGTGLGPAAGDETGGPLPAALPYLDSLYVGGSAANVRYAGRSGCCAGVDQIVFDVPAGVSGCYVPVAAVTGGVVSNFGTISVNATGKECDDPLSYRADDLIAAGRSGALRTGVVRLSGGTSGAVELSAEFFARDLNTLLAGTDRLVPSQGSCNLRVTRVGEAPAASGRGLNAGVGVAVNGPVGQWSADNTSSGNYFGSRPASRLSEGSYTFSSAGGSDVGPWTSSMNMGTPAAWSNAARFGGPTVAVTGPLTFAWNGGDAAGSILLSITSSNAIYDSRIECSAAPAAGTFTIPAFLTAAMYISPATVTFTYSTPVTSFAASGLDRGTVVISSTATAQTTLTR
jgi:uncharacterized protein (TIGR03437 family)